MKWFKRDKVLTNKINSDINELSDELIDTYVDEYLTVKGKFVKDTEYKMILNGKEYVSETQDFKFILDEPLVLTKDKTILNLPHRDIIELILPECTTTSDLQSLFSEMSNLKYLDISKVDWSNADNIAYLFSNTPTTVKIVGLDSLRTFKGKNATGTNIFNIDKDAYINLRGITSLEGVFEDMNPVHLCKYDLSGVETLNYQFTNNTGTFDYASCNLRPKSMDEAFMGEMINSDQHIKDIDISLVTYFSNCFSNATFDDGLCDIDQRWDTSNAENLRYMFAGTKTNTETLDVTWIDASNVKNIVFMFSYINIKILNVGMKNIKPEQITDSGYLFANAKAEIINFGSNFDISNSNIYYAPPSNYFHFSEFGGTYDTLRTVTGVIKLPKKLQHAYLNWKHMDRASALVFINGLPNVSGSYTCEVHKNIHDQLTEEDIAIITSKGWNISVVNN